MTTYLYFCKRCNITFPGDAVKQIRPRKVCPNCHKQAEEKKLPNGTSRDFKHDLYDKMIITGYPALWALYAKLYIEQSDDDAELDLIQLKKIGKNVEKQKPNT